MKKFLLTAIAATALLSASAAELKEWKSARYDDPILEFTGNVGTDLPFNSGYETTIAQLLYTEPQLTDLVTVQSGSKVYAEIQSFDIAVHLAGAYCNYYFYPVDIDFTVKVSTCDDVEFRRDEKTKKRLWFTQGDEAVTGSGRFEYNDETYPDAMYGAEPMAAYVHVELDKPILYQGGSLLLTIESTSSDRDVDAIGGCAGFETGTTAMLSGGEASSMESLAQLYKKEPKSADHRLLPAIKFNYKEVKDEAKVEIAQIENVTFGVRAAADGSANILSLDFDIADPSECQQYEVLLGTTKLGTVAGRHVTVSYLDNYTTEQTLSIRPTMDGVVGTSVAIAPGSFTEFFKEPDYRTVKTRAYAEYQAWDTTSKTVGGAAQVEYLIAEGAAPVVRMMAAPGAGVSVGTADWCSDFRTPSSDLNDFVANRGLRSFYQSNLWQNIPYKFGRLQLTSAGSLSVNCSVRYPVAVLAAPIVTDAEPASATVKYVDLKGPMYSPRIDPAEDGVFVETIEYRSGITMIDEGEGKFTFIAPGGHTIYVRFTPEAPAMRVQAGDLADYECTGSNIYVHDTGLSGNGSLALATTDANDQPALAETYEVTETGVAGVTGVTVDAPAAVEYFNLQGVRVAQPSGLVIRRQGSTVSKVMMK